jgi:hypothetical protein
MRKILLRSLLALPLLSGAATAQTPPYVYPITISTSSITILAADPTSQRKKLIFHNPNDSAKVAVCPVGPARVTSLGTANITAVINGAGCITILPYGSFEVPGIVGAGPQLNLSSAWVGIASAGGSALTIIEMI